MSKDGSSIHPTQNKHSNQNGILKIFFWMNLYGHRQELALKKKGDYNLQKILPSKRPSISKITWVIEAFIDAWDLQSPFEFSISKGGKKDCCHWSDAFLSPDADLGKAHSWADAEWLLQFTYSFSFFFFNQ